MNMTTVFDPRATMSVKGAHSLSHDPSRWDEPLSQSGWNSIVSLAKARHEVAATVSAIVGDGRRVELHHNTEGGWMVDVSNTATIVFHWSSVTVDEYGGQRPVTRGEALVSIVHECMHLLHTDEVEFPPWIQDRAHCEAFHTMLNFAEDVRIEDLGEDSVPAFANIRLTENDRMVSPNVRLWAQHDLVRKVCLPLFAERSCTSGSSLFSAVLASDFDVATLVNASRSSFLDATYASSTAEVAERLRPMYEAIAPYLPTSDGGHGGKGGDEGKGGEPGEGTGGDEAATAPTVTATPTPTLTTRIPRTALATVTTPATRRTRTLTAATRTTRRTGATGSSAERSPTPRGAARSSCPTLPVATGRTSSLARSRRTPAPRTTTLTRSWRASPSVTSTMARPRSFAWRVRRRSPRCVS
jgi:hypothetical protein